MAKMITFPTVLNSERLSLFDYSARTADKNSSGSTGSGDPAKDSWQVEKDSSYLTSSGNWSSRVETDCWKMEFAQSIGNHYWMTSFCGYLRHHSGGLGGINYSPLYDGIAHKLTFNWKKYDGAVASSKSKHRFRVQKFGLVHRNPSNTSTTRDAISVSGCDNLTKFSVGSATTSGTGTLTFSTDISQPVGFYVQLETEGGGTGNTSGSWVKLWNVNWVSNKSKEAIMSAYKSYSAVDPPAKREIWTA